MDRIDEDLYVISGHYRNGILLSPIIGRDIANGYSPVLSHIDMNHLVLQGG